MNGRIIALDVGSVRIGVAVSDPLLGFAQGLCVLRAAGEWADELAELIAEYDARTLLVGMPTRTDGRDGPEAAKMKKLVETLKKRFPDIKIEIWDERFTTAIAQAALIEADVSRKNRKDRVDKVAAALLLQNYLDFINKGADIPAYNFEADSMPQRITAKKKKKRDKAYD